MRRSVNRFTGISCCIPILFNYRHGLETAMKWIIELHEWPGNVEREDRDQQAAHKR
jgi:hypothetical protein